jgi:hypothetical protein
MPVCKIVFTIKQSTILSLPLPFIDIFYTKLGFITNTRVVTSSNDIQVFGKASFP